MENIQEEKKENKITVLLANHLFSKLTNAMGKHYLVDHRISKFEVCPCMRNCGEIIEYGSTGIGKLYSQTCIKRSPVGRSKRHLSRQMKVHS